MVFVCDDDSGQVTKLEAATGKVTWKAKLDGSLRSAPVLSDGTVFFGSSNSHCYAISAATGQTPVGCDYEMGP